MQTIERTWKLEIGTTDTWRLLGTDLQVRVWRAGSPSKAEYRWQIRDAELVNGSSCFGWILGGDLSHAMSEAVRLSGINR